MATRSWLRTLFSPEPRPNAARPRTRPRARLAVEALEGRLAPATLTVISNADDPTLTQDSRRAAVASIEQGADQNANIQRTGAYGANDTIVFNLPAGQRTITLTSNDSNLGFGPTALVVTADMTIDGSTQAGLTISGDNARRVFAVAGGATLTLQDLTVTGGKAQGGGGGNVIGAGAGPGGGGGAGLGGAIYNVGTLDLIGCTLTGNTATGGNGGAGRSVGTTGGGGGGSAGFKGGDFNGGGNAGGGGAGIAGPGDTNSGRTGGKGGANEFGTQAAEGTDGTTGGGGGGGGRGSGGFGGGFGNGAGGRGGGGLGGAVFNNGGSVTLTNCTLTGNTAHGGNGGAGAAGGQGLGGAVFSRNGTVVLVNSTLSGNTADQGGRQVYLLGDGAQATATLNNGILAQADPLALDFVAASLNGGTTTTSGSHNLIGTQRGFTGGALSLFPSAIDLDFEMPSVGPASFAYLPSGSPWIFAGSSGLASNGSGFGNPPAPQGSQVAFLQGTDSSISQAVDLAAGSYALAFSAAQRPGNQQTFQVLVDGAVVATVTPSGSHFVPSVIRPIAFTAGSHTIAFAGLNPQGGDNTAFLGPLRIYHPVPLLGPLQDNGGPTQTMALLSGSPAIDAGTSSGAPLTDQRGLARDAQPDLGAFEFEKVTPVLTWTDPVAIVYGTALGATQLNATAGVPGTFAYTPAAGTVLGAGSHTLSVTFTPTDTASYKTASASVTLTVDRATPALTLASSANPAVSGQPVTLTATVGAAGPAAPAGTVTFSDGGTALATVPVVNGQARYTTAALARGSHALTARYSGDGTYTASTSAPLTQTVQAVACEPDPLDPARTALAVGGTAGNDLIVIGPGPRPGTAQVLVQGGSPDRPTSLQVVSLQGVSRVLVYGGRGDDTLVVDPALALPALLDGGPGNDTLAAGGGPSILVGGEGNDTLAGGPGRGLLIGGAGADILRAGAGQAVLIGGTTDCDRDAAALGRLLQEWSRPDLSYSARVSHLLGGGGLNGSVLLSAATAHDDGAADQLLGGSDLDLYVFGPGDLVGQKPGDTAVQL